MAEAIETTRTAELQSELIRPFETKSGSIDVLEAERTSEIQREEALSTGEELSELLQVEADKARATGQLNLSRETVLRILELFSKRECITDQERTLIREMITDISDKLKDSKKAQAGIHLAFSLVGGACGIVGGVKQTEALSAFGNMLHGFGGASNPFFTANQVWMEVGKQLRMNDLSQEDRLAEQIHRGMDRMREAVSQTEQTWHGARRTR